MRTKSAIFYKAKQPISVEATELADPQEREVLVRVEAAGACHSDYHAVDGHSTGGISPMVGRLSPPCLVMCGSSQTSMKVLRRGNDLPPA